jgi:urease accessory protein
MSSLTQTAGRHPGAYGWRAALRLRFSAREGRTYLSERQHTGPLLVQRPFYPEPDVCHCYVVHPPGGVVGGDNLSVEVLVESGASSLMTTPAAGKFYRSAKVSAQLVQTFDVKDRASFEWLPQESIFYNGAHVHATTKVRLASQARFIGWDVTCLGLPARRESFDSGALRLGFELEVQSVPRWLERLRIDGGSASLTARWGLAHFNAVGTMLAYPGTRASIEELRPLCEPGVELAFTLVDEVLVCRALSAQAEPIRRALMQCWRKLRPNLMGRDAHPPRIWAT